MIKRKSYEIINSCLEWVKEVVYKSDNIVDAKEILEDKRLEVLKKECYRNILLDDQYYLLGKLTHDTLNIYFLEDNSKKYIEVGLDKLYNFLCDIYNEQFEKRSKWFYKIKK